MILAEAGFSKSSISFPVIGKLIEFLQKGRYSHAWIKVFFNGNWWAIDASSHTVRVRLFSEFAKQNIVVKKYNISTEEKIAENIFWWGMMKSGRKYPKMEVLGNLIQIIFRLKKNPLGQGEFYPRCNELVAICLKEIFNHEIKEDLDSVDLIWLDNYLQKNLK